MTEKKISSRRLLEQIREKEGGAGESDSREEDGGEEQEDDTFEDHKNCLWGPEIAISRLRVKSQKKISSLVRIWRSE
ncbi:unnamed protein product [Microthlaspi erraticum]|uniref:Uncharacterized protein n=1 Tax=Microthlaspi erraticum TaxID=1685480 RepID=A0A6D2IWS4_9BRAS|nr:unnamed protein product [Microthlaspi erraticum]